MLRRVEGSEHCGQILTCWLGTPLGRKTVSLGLGRSARHLPPVCGKHVSEMLVMKWVMVVGEGDGPSALELSPMPLTFFPTSHRSETEHFNHF